MTRYSETHEEWVAAHPPKQKSLYLIGSLRNKKIPKLGVELRKIGFDVFDDWHGAGPEADDEWRKYETIRGRSYADALRGLAAGNTFGFDHRHLDRCDIGVLCMPGGKSAHFEIGRMIGQGKKCFVLFEEVPERWDLMYRFVFETGGDVFFDYDTFMAAMKQEVA